MVSASIFPVFCDSSRTNSSARASMASAIFSSACCRWLGVVLPHSAKAASAAAYAASTSPSPLTGAVATTAPVEGLTTSARASARASTYAPLTKFRKTLGVSDIPQLSSRRWQEPFAPLNGSHDAIATP